MANTIGRSRGLSTTAKAHIRPPNEGPGMDLKQHIRAVPDFPKPGILFYDISTLLAHADAWRERVDRLAADLAPRRPDFLVGVGSRGFLVATPLARSSWDAASSWCASAASCRGRRIPLTYQLEYGTDTIEIQADAIARGQRVAVLDDLLATGSTLAAAIALCRNVGGNVVAAACDYRALVPQQPEPRSTLPVTSVVAYRSLTQRDGRTTRSSPPPSPPAAGSSPAR